MLENFTDPEQRDGIRGFFLRHFSKVTHADVARDEARSLSGVFLVVAALSFVAALLQRQVALAIGPVVLALLAWRLRAAMSRGAAVALLVIALLDAALAFPAFLPFVLVLIGARATQLTFAFHRLRARTLAGEAPPVALRAPASPPAAGA